MSGYNSPDSGFNKYDPISPVRDQLSIDAVNQLRVKAWNQVMLAFGAVAIVGLVYIASEVTVWTGGLLIAGAWVFNSLRTLRAANQEIIALESTYGVALKTELPTMTKIGIALAVPVAVLAGVGAVNTYDPSILGIGGVSGNQNSSDELPRIVKTVELTESEATDSGFEFALGVDIWVPQTCSEAILYWHTENSSGTSFSNFTNSYSSLSTGEVNELYMGTDAALSDEELYFVTDSVECI